MNSPPDDLATEPDGDPVVVRGDPHDREAPAPALGPATDVFLGDETMELLAYGDVEAAKRRHDGTVRVVPPKDTMQD